MKGGAHLVFSLPDSSINRNRYQSTAGLTKEFQVIGWPRLDSNSRPVRDFLHTRRFSIQIYLLVYIF